MDASVNSTTEQTSQKSLSNPYSYLVTARR